MPEQPVSRPRSLLGRGRPRLLARAVLAAALLLGAAATGYADTHAGRAVRGAADAGPAVREGAGAGAFWVEPDSAAARQAAEWRRQGKLDDARMIERIAERPQAVWLNEEEPGAAVRAQVAAASKQGRTAVLVAYFIPHRDCGEYSAGGARDAARYRGYVEAFAAGLGTTGAYVIVEPDAVAHMVAGCAGAAASERYELLAHAVRTLKSVPNTKVYLDAGNAGWIPDVHRLVSPLRAAGIAAADGFALNVANYYTDEVSTAYGHRLSQALGGGVHFVIDSSRDGNGPYTGPKAWCNPPGRALGTPPTTRTGDAALDAYLWIKRPGESDGTCRGGPKAGQWWPEYALGLARRAKAQPDAT